MKFKQHMKIPIDKELSDFNDYLQKNDHVIFSAPFGDGKSYFLHEFQTEFKEKYVFVSLYPVNYQVVDTYDVFELIKRDILVQLIANGIFVSDDIEIPEGIYAYYYMIHLGAKLEIENLVPLMDALNLDETIKAKFLAVDSFWKALSKLKRGYDEYKQKIDQSKAESKIDNYLRVFSQGKGKIYEFDMMSFLISSFIKQFKEKHPEKQIVLCLEDLDRLDPAHIFRILNILSAHVDRQFISFDEQESFGVRSNKFGFDKTIVVCDYPKIESLFFHFYGKDSNFDGYISKFTSSNPFRYSFRGKVCDKLISTIEALIHFDDDALRKFFYTQKNAVKVHNLNVRTLEYLISDFLKDIRCTEVVFPDGISENVEEVKLLQVFVIFSRLGILGSSEEKTLVSFLERSNLNALNDMGRMLLFGLPDFTDRMAFMQHMNGEDRALVIKKEDETHLSISLANIFLPQQRVDYQRIIDQIKTYLL